MPRDKVGVPQRAVDAFNRCDVDGFFAERRCRHFVRRRFPSLTRTSTSFGGSNAAFNAREYAVADGYIDPEAEFTASSADTQSGILL
jgi:hypothetical protein